MDRVRTKMWSEKEGLYRVNLQKLFEIQRILDEKIVKEKGLEGQDLLDKKILSLQVELGELANEWRGFKFWSKDQKPRTELWKDCNFCGGRGFVSLANYPYGHQRITCIECRGEGQFKTNPLLEEYVDCLHFILSIGNDIAYLTDDEIEEVLTNAKVPDDYGNIVDTFIVLNSYSCELKHCEKCDYINLLTIFLNLGYELGFTDEQIEQGYLDKNKINHQRQSGGY